jgi:hypothetical protein
MHDSFTALGGMVPLANIGLGEVIFGGVGAGLYGFMVYAVLAVFIAGLMVGRTPEYLGKKIEAFDVKMAMLIGRYLMIVPILALAGNLAAKKRASGTTGTFPTTGGIAEALQPAQDVLPPLKIVKAKRIHASPNGGPPPLGRFRRRATRRDARHARLTETGAIAFREAGAGGARREAQCRAISVLPAICARGRRKGRPADVAACRGADTEAVPIVLTASLGNAHRFTETRRPLIAGPRVVRPALLLALLAVAHPRAALVGILACVSDFQTAEGIRLRLLVLVLVLVFPLAGLHGWQT